MINIDTCPICGGTELVKGARKFMSEPTFDVMLDGLVFRGVAFVVYAQCITCGVFIQSPRMGDAEINSYYATGSYRKWLKAQQEALDANENARAVQDAALLKQLIGEVESHLDIGSSRGYFLKHMGAEIQVGVELNTGYNQNTYATLISSIDAAPFDERYELVTAIHSLEHSIDPMASLRAMAVRSYKYLVIEVPSEHSPGGWGRLAHTFHFPEETIFYMAELIGWKVKVVYHTPHTFVIMENNEVRA